MILDAGPWQIRRLCDYAALLRYLCDNDPGYSHFRQKLLSPERAKDEAMHVLHVGHLLRSAGMDVQRLFEEKKEIAYSLMNMAESSSNLKNYFAIALEIALKLTTGWTSNNLTAKERLQKLVFPEGILYDHEKGALPGIFSCVT